MGFINFFKKGPLTAKKIDKIVKLVVNPYAQSDVRMREMERLIEDSSHLALEGVMKRFDANANGSIADEDEKKWLEDTLVKKGEVSIKPLESYIKKAKQLTFALRTYHRLNNDEDTIQFFIDTLENYGPDNYQNTDAKLQIVLTLIEFINKDDKIAPALIPFVQDHSDEIKWVVLDVFSKFAKENKLKTESRNHLCEKLSFFLTQDSSPRIQNKVAEIISDNEWKVSKEIKKLHHIFENIFFLDKKYFLRRRIKKI